MNNKLILSILIVSISFLIISPKVQSQNFEKSANAIAVSNCDWKFEYVDNFDKAYLSTTSDFGLNNNLAFRQLYGSWTGTTWVRKPGELVSKIVQPKFSQVNNPLITNVLSFQFETSAVMLNKLITANAGRYRVSFRTNPAFGEQTSSTWTSVMLDASNANNGNVAGTQFGFSIASNGNVAVYQNGNQKTVTGTLTPADEYNVELDIQQGSLIAKVNGISLTATLNELLPTQCYAFLGANIAPNSCTESWIDDLVINTQLSTAAKRIDKYGYYWVSSSSFGDHFDEVSDYTNFNFIENITPKMPNTKTNVLSLHWDFIDAEGGLSPNWKNNWKNKLTIINQNIDKIAALYFMDEPFWLKPMTVTEYNTVLDQMRTDLPDLPIFTVFAYPTVNDLNDTQIQNISNSMTWVGADYYVSVN